MDYIKEPRRKRHVYVTREQPFPVVIESVSGITVSNRLWQTYTGHYNGDCVVVEKESDIHALYRKGYFGKASLSKNFPSFGKFKNDIPPFISERQWKQRSKWKEALKVQDALKNNPACIKLEQNEAHNSDENMDVGACSSLSGVAYTGYSLQQAAGPQAFPPDWENRQKDTDATQAVNTSYRPPTIKFRREPRNRHRASVPPLSEVAGSDRTQVLSAGAERKFGISSADTLTVDIPSTNGSQHSSSLQVHTNVKRISQGRPAENLDCGTESEKESYGQKGVRQMGDRLTLTNQDETVPRIVHHAAADEVVVLRDSDSEDEELRLEKLDARLVKNPYQLREHLQLMLEEAFFLSYALGCLQVLDLSGKAMTLRDVWETFRKSDVEFVQKYVAYHHFRSKGWVVKSGIKYGGDFLLYKEGPPFYHASYIVMIEVLAEAGWSRSPSHNRQSVTWASLFGTNRLAETVGKEILICRVIWPASVAESGPRTPQQLARFCVEEVLLKRWVSSQEREELDNEDIIE